jgi:hypothetical protein
MAEQQENVTSTATSAQAEQAKTTPIWCVKCRKYKQFSYEPAPKEIHWTNKGNGKECSRWAMDEQCPDCKTMIKRFVKKPEAKVEAVKEEVKKE